MSKNKSRKKFEVAILTILAVFVMCSATWAATYYIDATNGNDGNPGTLSQPWKTITKANSTLNAGDTVYIRGGTYTDEQIYPSNNGTVNNRIVYQNYNDETVTITASDTPLLLSNRSYITVHGITITNCDKYLTMINGHYNNLAYLTISNMRNYERYGGGFLIGTDSSYNWVHHSTISGYGDYAGGDDLGEMVFIGGNPPGDSSHNLIEDNHFYHGGHNVLVVTSKYSVIRNNYFHNEEWKKGYGNRISSMKDLTHGNKGWNLIEGNRFCFTGIPNDDNYGKGVQLPSGNNIFRRNMFYASKGPAICIETIKIAQYASNNYIYNNVFFYNGIGGIPESRKYALWYRGGSYPSDGGVVKNNIFYENQYTTLIKKSGDVTNMTIENNWEESGDPFFVDAVPAKTNDPFDQDYPDFNLASNSGCIDNGGWLTTINSSTGSGTSFVVDDAHYFFDGWSLPAYMGVTGDMIKTSAGQSAVITSINYDTNTITVNSSISWTQDEGIALFYNGALPDQGAIESGVDNDNTIEPPGNLRVVQQY